jgi:hypothetical protein
MLSRVCRYFGRLVESRFRCGLRLGRGGYAPANPGRLDIGTLGVVLSLQFVSPARDGQRSPPPRVRQRQT